MNVKTRDYDEEPIEVSNNFTSIVFGIVFWLMFNGLIIYLVFFGDAIDWTQNKDWIAVFREEIADSLRFWTVLMGTIVVNIMAFISLFKNLKNSKKIVFKNKIIESSKYFNDLTQLNLIDIKSIKKSFFPLLVTNKANFIIYLIASLFGLLSFLISWSMRFFAWGFYLIFQQSKPYITTKPYITVFSKKTNRVINIHIISEKEYLQLRRYFLEILNIDLSKVDTNFKLSNIQQGV